jgi:hypothetical protein
MKIKEKARKEKEEIKKIIKEKTKMKIKEKARKEKEEIKEIGKEKLNKKVKELVKTEDNNAMNVIWHHLMKSITLVISILRIFRL